jgi:hypothetical protein
MTITDSLSITCRQSDADNTAATLEVSECFRDFGFPGAMYGRFLDLTQERLLHLASGRDVRVAFRGASYQFVGIAPDGSFTLRRYRAA